MIWLITWFWPRISAQFGKLKQFSSWGWWKAQQSLTCTREVWNKCDMTGTPFSWLANHNHNNWLRSLSISSLPPICSPSFSFIWWGWKKRKKVKINKTWMGAIFLPKSYTGHTYWRCGLLRASPGVARQNSCSNPFLIWLLWIPKAKPIAKNLQAYLYQISLTPYKLLIQKGSFCWHSFWPTPFDHSQGVVCDYHKSNKIFKLYINSFKKLFFLAYSLWSFS